MPDRRRRKRKRERAESEGDRDPIAGAGAQLLGPEPEEHNRDQVGDPAGQSRAIQRRPSERHSPSRAPAKRIAPTVGTARNEIPGALSL